MTVHNPEVGTLANGPEMAQFEARQEPAAAETAEQQALREYVEALTPGITEKLAEFRRTQTTMPLFITTGDHPFDQALVAEVFEGAQIDKTKQLVTDKEVTLRISPEAGAVIQAHLFGIDESMNMGQEFLEKPVLHDAVVYEYPMEGGYLREVKFETYTRQEGLAEPVELEHTVYFAAPQSAFRRS